jgi:hypothetical protein
MIKSAFKNTVNSTISQSRVSKPQPPKSIRLKLHRLEADTDPENLPSLALLEKFGVVLYFLFMRY